MAVAQVRLDLVAEVPHAEHDPADAVALEQRQLMVHERPPGDRDQRLGEIGGQRTEAGAPGRPARIATGTSARLTKGHLSSQAPAVASAGWRLAQDARNLPTDAADVILACGLLSVILNDPA